MSDEDVRLVYNLTSEIKKGIQINTNKTIDETIKEIIKKLSS